MARGVSTLPAYLIIAHYVTQSAKLSLQAFFMTGERPSVQDPSDPMVIFHLIKSLPKVIKLSIYRFS